ncbi:MAG TPA: GntR family transcriptional regulator [Burkholderiaceae bacterium]|nr:GntR family transcriptional regulator [Burkholderiaceae bacterium]
MKSPRVQQLINSITEAIVSRRLLPGTRLPERELGDIFGISRTLVRTGIAQLKSNGLVEAPSPKITIVAQPSVEDAQTLFSAMQTIESGAVQKLSGALSATQLKRLHRHVALETAAHRRGDDLAANQLGRDFHALLLAQLGNPLLLALFQSLLTREAVISALYCTEYDYDHLCDDHTQLLDNLAAGRTKEAQDIVSHHWNHVVKGIRIHSANSEQANLAAILRV